MYMILVEKCDLGDPCCDSGDEERGVGGDYDMLQCGNSRRRQSP